LRAGTKYGGTVTNVKRKRVPGGGRGAATAKLREPKHVGGHVYIVGGPCQKVGVT